MRSDIKEFSMGQYRWLSTIKQHHSEYESHCAPKATYDFINVKLPNDGYIYDGRFETSQEALDTSSDASEFVKDFINNLRATNLFAAKPLIYANYSAIRTEFDIYCVDAANKRILTVNFHYGYPAGKIITGTLENWARDIDWKYGSE